MGNHSHIPQIKTLSEIRLAGIAMQMSLAQNSTLQLWQRFMPFYKKQQIWAGKVLYSVEEYDAEYFTIFSTQNTFTKWAAAPLKANAAVPKGLKELILPQGLYAIFTYKGKAASAGPMYHYIFTKWLPESGYQLDARPHFALMGERYKNNSSESEEEIWVPVRG